MKPVHLPQFSPTIVIVAGSLVLLLAFGIRAGFGLFLQPISLDLGGGRGAFALALALQNLFWGVAQPFAGAVADKYGSGRTILAGGLAYALGLVWMASVEFPWELYLSGGLLIGLGMSGVGLSVVFGAMGRVVPPEKQTIAMGIGTAAGSLGQFLVVPAGQFFLDSYGWSTALLLLSLCSLVIVPAAVALTGSNAPNQNSRETQPQLGLKAALREAFGHSGFLYLTAGFFVCGFQVVFIGTHLPAYLIDEGLDAKYGAWALSLVGLFNIIGSFSAGVIGGRYSKKYSLSFLYVARALAVLVFILLPTTPTSVLIFSAIIGLLWLSTVPLTSGIVAQIFGPQYFATLFGIVFFSHQIGSFLGAWLGGYLYDTSGSYEVVWWISIALGLVAALLHWPINEQSLRPVPSPTKA